MELEKYKYYRESQFWPLADELNTMLPVKNGVPDYKMIETLISTVKKIKNVADYAD